MPWCSVLLLGNVLVCVGFCWGLSVLFHSGRGCVSGSRIVVRLGWSLALGWRPAMVLRWVWYRLGLCLYRASSFFLSLSLSFLFALFMIVEIALWHREDMSSLLGG